MPGDSQQLTGSQRDMWKREPRPQNELREVPVSQHAPGPCMQSLAAPLHPCEDYGRQPRGLLSWRGWEGDACREHPLSQGQERECGQRQTFLKNFGGKK